MIKTYGKFNPDGGPGLLRAIEFPQLALMDTKTGDSRLLVGEGGGVRELPRPMKAAWVTGFGHDGGVPVGVLQEVTFGDDGVISGKGWLIDDENGRRQEWYLETSAIFHNSVDLAEVKVKVNWVSDDPADGEDFWTVDHIAFTQWNIGATHFVDLPAFPDAHGELVASFAPDRSQPLVVEFASHRIEIETNDEPAEIVASLAGDIVEPFADYHIPEADMPTPFTIDAEGRMFGHFAGTWGTCHDGIEGRCVVAPKPAHYADFHAPGILTERGMIEVGPVFFLGGHPRKPLGKGDAFAAYGGVENVIGYVRVVNGQIGPWCSGRVVPGLEPEAVYVARASRKSAHYRVDQTLAAIVCCNVPGFRVPGSKLSLDEDGAVYEDGKVLELVASFRGPTPDPVTERAGVAEALELKLAADPNFRKLVFNPSYNSTISPSYVVHSGGTLTGRITVDADHADPAATARQMEIALLELEIDSA
jgi:hypothetical protein